MSEYKVLRTVETIGASFVSSSSREAPHESSRSSSEALAVIITMSAFAFVVYLPYALVWCVLTSFISFFSADVSSLLTLLRRFFLLISQLAHSTNFYVYCLHMRVFRMEFVRMLACYRCALPASLSYSTNRLKYTASHAE